MRKQRFSFLGALGALILPALVPTPSPADFYLQKNLVSDGFIPAPHIDPNLKNPWGISFAPGGPFWVSDNVTGVATLYKGNGTPIPLVVTIPPAAGSPTGSPTGQVFNQTAFTPSPSFLVAPGKPAFFIFASLDGTISAWNPTVMLTSAVTVATQPGASYTGLAHAKVGSDNFLFAANAAAGTIDKFDKDFGFVSSFSDPTIPAGFVPFNIQNLGGTLYVTFAPFFGAGGFVDVFDAAAGTFTRLISGSPLNGPWGLALAPSNFGPASNDLLVGNLFTSDISAFDPTTGAFVDSLRGSNGLPIFLTADGTPGDGLWALAFGNGGPGAPPNTLFFTSGINDEKDGLFGSLRFVPEPGSMTLFLLGAVSLGASCWWTRKR